MLAYCLEPVSPCFVVKGDGSIYYNMAGIYSIVYMSRVVVVVVVVLVVVVVVVVVVVSLTYFIYVSKARQAPGGGFPTRYALTSPGRGTTSPTK